jgi:arabinofuranosyltransferase
MRSRTLGLPSSPWIPAGIAALLLAIRVHRLFDPSLIVDDAFISFRYAENLAHGFGLVYNLGQRVEGYTNFLWTILLAAAARAGATPVFTSIALNLLAALGSIAILAIWAGDLFAARKPAAGYPLEPGNDVPPARSARSMGLFLAALPPLLFAAFGSQARYVVSGMETLLFGFLVLAATWFLLQREEPLAAGLTFALAAMTRPEGVLYFFLAGCGYALEVWRRQTGRNEETPVDRSSRRHSWLLLIAGFVVPFGCYVVWRWHYYSDPLPNTFYAKAGGFEWARIERGLESLRSVTGSWGMYPVIALMVGSLPSLLARRSGQRVTILRVAALDVLATVGYFVFVGGDFLEFFGPRFFMPVLPFALLLTAEGLGNCAEFLRRPGRGSLVPSPVRIGLVLGSALLLLLNAFAFSWPSRDFQAGAFAQIMESWEDLGLWIGAMTPRGSVIADGGAGIVPYYSERSNIDMYGLTDRHIGHMKPLEGSFKKTAHEKFDPGYVLSKRPDFIVTQMSRDRAPRTAGLVRVKDWFWACYRPWALLRREPTPSGGWVVPSRVYTGALYDQGFQTVVFERRRGRAKVGCEAYERAIGLTMESVPP